MSSIQKAQKIQGLKGLVNGLEDAIIVISGPALAISGIIAGLDLLTGGTVLKDNPNLGMVWAVCLLLTLDFQVLNLGVRFKRIYHARATSHTKKVIELALCVLVAAGISFVSIQMQAVIARANVDAHTSIQTAEAALGINGEWLIWERSTLVLVLIFMSGLSRGSEEESQAQPDATITPTVNPHIEEALTRLESRLERVEKAPAEIAEVLFQRLQVSFAQASQGTNVVEEGQETKPMTALPEQAETTVHLPEPDKLQRTQAFLAANPAGTDEELAIELGLSRPASARFWRLKAQEMAKASVQGAENLNEIVQPIFTGTFESKEAAVKEAVAQNPDASDEEIARIAQCSVRTAKRWRVAV